MNGYALIASLFQSLVSLAWPLAAVICVYLFREKLKEILPRLHLRHKETEISFRLAEAAKEADELAAKEPSATAPSERFPDRLLKLAEVSPSAAIMEGWKDVEEAVHEVSINRFGPSYAGEKKGLVAAKNLVFQLQVEGQIDRETVNLLGDLMKIRNEVAHATYKQKPSFEDALRYYDLSRILITHLRSLPQQAG